MNPYLFNFVNGVLFVFLSFWALSLDWDYAYYFISLGVVFIVLTYFVRHSDKILGSVAMILTCIATLILGILFFTQLEKNTSYLAPVGMMLISGCVSTLAFLQCAINHNQVINKQDSNAAACCDTGLSKDSATGCC